MGLMPEQIHHLTYPEFVILLSGYNRRLEQQWDYVRHTMSYIATFRPFNNKFVKPQDVMSLKRDTNQTTKYITTRVEALSLLQRFAELLNIA